MDTLIGIDCGLTNTKAVVFDLDGSVLAVSTQSIKPSVHNAGYVEHDLIDLWKVVATVIKKAVTDSGRDANTVRALSFTARGDGLFLLDRQGLPLGGGIASLDSRASSVVEQWNTDQFSKAALALTGQVPHVSAPATLLSWIKSNEPERYSKIGQVITCKDWLRYCLTNTIGTDRTEASTLFTNVATQNYDQSVLALYNLEEIQGALPDISHSAEVVGHVTESASKLTGLVQGTPVAAGLHDVTASAYGMNGQKLGCIDVISGTYSINQIVSNKPILDKRWFCRNGVEPGTWNNMSISPASTANYDWLLNTFFTNESDCPAEARANLHATLNGEITNAFLKRSSVFFHPYIYGSPFGSHASGSFTGIKGWHERGVLIRAVFEGIAFNHRYHVDALKSTFCVNEVKLTGGISRNTIFSELMANVLGMPVTVPRVAEAAAWGAAKCAGVAVGCYESMNDDPRDHQQIDEIYRPSDIKVSDNQERYEMFMRLAELLSKGWSELEAFSMKGGQNV